MIAFICHLHVLDLQPQEEGWRKKKPYVVWSEPNSSVITGCPWHILALFSPGRFGGEYGRPAPQGCILETHV